jgi:hypothetical protein
LLEKQLREAEQAIKVYDSNFKTSESKRFTLSKQLEEKIQETTDKARKLREQYGSSPRLGARPDKSLIISEPSHSDLFHDVNSILSSILGSFKYPESTIGLSLKDDKQLKEICSKLNEYQNLSSYAFGFINILAKIISLKLT